MEIQPYKITENRYWPDAERVYRNEQIAVYWEPKLCTHLGNCFRGLPEVFQPGSHPWVRVEAASPDAIAAAVLSCPTGALHFERLDGGPPESQEGTTTIQARPNGPLNVRGPVRLEGPDGQVIREDTRLSLCRCGASENKPFCDATHRRIGFQG